MAITNISACLIGSYQDGRNVSSKDFTELLQLPATHWPVRIEADRGPWASAFVEFLDLTLNAFDNEPEPYAAFDREIHQRIEVACKWLTSQSDRVKALTDSGLTLCFLIDMQIDNDQLDLTIPPDLLLACGQCQIPIQLITND
jgi:hypothetical protein